METQTANNTPTGSKIVPISRRRKAAMIVQMLISDGGKLELSSLPEPMQESIARELGSIRLVDRETVSAVAAEFTRDLKSIGLSAPGSPDAALQTLSSHLSPELANRLRAELASAQNGDPWTMILAMTADEILPIMQSQSVEICAVTLSKLPVALAAEVLSKLPGERARRITYAVSQTSEISPDAVRRIGTALVADHCGRAAVAFEKAPVQRVGAILNSSPALTRDSVLEGLGTADEVFANDVRKAIFTFPDIPSRLVPTDIPACIRGVDAADLATAISAALALGDAFAEAAEFILANISQRMAGGIREEAAEKGTVKKSVGEAAMGAVTAEIRALADAGSITFIDPDAAEGE